MTRLFCLIFGHAKPDSSVTALFTLLTLRHTWQCPRCGKVTEGESIGRSKS